jgi:GTP pyrophosphokinase
MSNSELLNSFKSFDPDIDISLIEKAYDFAQKAHKTQLRHSGDPYISHPLEVAKILASLKLDVSTITTGLLHDTLEDTEASKEDIIAYFGNEVANLVEGVTKLSKIDTFSENKSQAENFRKLILAMSKDIRVLLVKLADRLHNMRTIQFIPNESSRKRIASETLEIYAPLAGRLGMHEFKDELEDLSFQILNPSAYASILNRIEYLKKDKSNLTDKIKSRILEILEEKKIDCSIIGREKKVFSIWNKMQKKQIAFRQLSDIFAYRILVSDINDCYKVLGIIHGRWSAVPGNFKDYLSTPKINNYQSIHTTIVGPERQRVELQIRTKNMDVVAERGIAAHWSYKDTYNLIDHSSSDPINVTWLRDLVDILDSGATSEELLEATKLEIFQDEVFCFTPKGDLIHLPYGSNSIDFAYALHSEIGNKCVGCKINGKSQALFTKIQNGDEIEIITSKSEAPSETWENIVTTAKAQSSIKRYFKKQEKNEFINLGKEILLKTLNVDKEIAQHTLASLISHFKKKSNEDLFNSIGRGYIKPREIIKARPKNKLSFFSRYRYRNRKPQKIVDLPLEIKNLQSGVAIHFAECCMPLPNEDIIGIQEKDTGIIIHTRDCKTLTNDYSRSEWITSTWKNTKQNQLFSGRIKASVKNEAGSLGKLATVIGSNNGNITNLNISEKSNDFFDMIFVIELRDLIHLNFIIEKLKENEIVSDVKRLFID